ncbi:carboxypeptidase-like regulatory domain-containing protein [Owenweeksia hongkongensis]|uniref:carboxypeptidase-like regulatory domain-containing protein n=1 Tax=Owenweeksia hongkongensis TaxID=253245 RepID=UPI003A8ED017
MNIEALENLGKIAGIAGISIGALVLIFGSVIRKNIFPGLTKEQGYTVIRMMIIGACVLALVGIAAWIYVDVQKNQRDKEAILVSKYITGHVKDADGKPVVSAEVEVAQYPEAFDRTDGSGKFAVRLNGKGSKYLDVVLKHKNYKLIRQKVKVNFDEEGEDILIDQIVMETAYPPDPVREDVVDDNDYHQGKSNDPGYGNDYSKPVSNNLVSANLIYMGDMYNCILDITVNIAGQTIQPTGNRVLMQNLRAGNQTYSINGLIGCGTERCQATGTGEVFIQQGANYYVMWNYNTCVVGIYDEVTYNALSGL